MNRDYSMTPSAVRKREYAVRVVANGGLLGGHPSHNRCMVPSCEANIPPGFTVCGPEHGAILTAQFDAWRADGGPANVFGRYRHV